MDSGTDVDIDFSCLFTDEPTLFYGCFQTDSPAEDPG